MTRIRRSWQGLGLLLGLAGTLLLLSGQGCPMGPAAGDYEPVDESNTGQVTTDDSTKADPVGGAAVQVIFPNGGETVEANTIVEVRVFARHPSIPDPMIRVFYDRDSNGANGNTTIGTIKASTGGLGWDLTGLATGTYWVGAEIVGVTPAVVDYSDGSFQVVPAGGGPVGPPGPDDGGEQELLLTVTAPRNTIPLFQVRTFTIRWSTNLLPGEGTATVFREPDFDEDNVPDGHAFRDIVGTPGIDAAQQTLDFDATGIVGNYFIGVTVTANDGRTATAYSLGTLKILSPALWVGDLSTKRDEQGRVINQSGSFQGAVLKGFEPYDNLGSAMVAADDYDGDGRNEFVVAAQFAKPWFFFSPDGRGAGEAYMIYGSARLHGDYEINTTGQSRLPGVIFTGVLPNPHGHEDLPYGNNYSYTVDGRETQGYETEGLRAMTMIPDQDGDGKREIAFSFPWCDSYSLYSMARDGVHPVPLSGIGRLENDGHFLRGGVVMVSSANPLMTNRAYLNRHLDRYIMLQEVGQMFAHLGVERNEEDHCPGGPMRLKHESQGVLYGDADTITYPCDGFWQNTQRSTGYPERIDPPRLADPQPAYEMVIPGNDVFGCAGRTIDATQIDPPPVPSSNLFFGGRAGGDYFAAGYCDGPPPLAPLGQMHILGTGYYVEHGATTCANQVFAKPVEPFGCRILGQTTTQLYTNPPTTANRFGASISTSGGFLLVGAPMRTPLKTDVDRLPDLGGSRFEAGEVYMLELRRQGSRPYEFFWRLPDPPDDNDPTTPAASQPFSDEIPQPHNFIIDDVGYTRYNDGGCGANITVNSAWWEMGNPIRIVGANPSDRIGDAVNGLYDLDNDGVNDVAIGGAGTNSGRGGVYVLYRRQPGLEGDYLLEHVQGGVQDSNGQYGLFIIGEEGENLGTSLGGLGPANLRDDYNDDGFSDLLIGSPNASPASGFEAGEAFILAGGQRLSTRPSRITDGHTDNENWTLGRLREANKGVLLIGAEPGDRAGETVAPAGDVNGDDIPDFLIAAPNATVPDIKFSNPGQDSPRSLRVSFQYDSNGDGVPDKAGIGIDRNGDGKADPLNGNNELDVDGNVIYDADDDLTDAGVVYLVFGGTHLKGTIKLDEIGTKALPGLVFVGRATGNELGGGRTQNNLLSRGLAFAGDLDGDGFGDLMISSVLADPEGKENAGEVYVIYGFAP